MKSTADFGVDERPKNFRAGILRRSPRSNAPLFALTSMMKSEKTSDPNFKWWEEDAQMFGFQLGADISNAVTTIPIDNVLGTGATKLKPGDMLLVSATLEAMRIVSIVSDTSITVQRAVGAAGKAAGTAAAATAANGKMLYIGSAYREGAPRSIGVSYNPSQKDNVTQIFRDPIEWTRTAMQTTYITGNPEAEDKRRALHKHAMGIERAMFLGQRYETLEAGQPLRFTDGLLSFIPASNMLTVTAGGVDMDELESYFAAIFAYGSKEKLAWGSVKTMTILNQIVRKNTSYQWEPGGKEYGMDVTRFRTPAGTLVLTEHPLFGQAGQFLAEDLLILDTENLRYRYVQDTIYLKDRQDRGTDGRTDEYLTECGLEVHHGITHFLLRGFKSAAVDN
jgi:hypothetical protein